MLRNCELSILMPCLNEAETLGACIDKAAGFLRNSGIDGEVIVADNGSTDESQTIAAAHGARVVVVATPGYGAALLGGIQAAHGRYVIMGDSDGSYDFAALDPFVEALRQGFDLVMGNRFRGGIAEGAMPALHRYLGNPVLSAIGRLLFATPCGDFHCGLRGFRRDAVLALELQGSGMEFASEMVVKASVRKLRVTEVPTRLSPDGRSRPPHLRSWRDGWRHLRFLLLFSPRGLFFYPGIGLFAAGLLVAALLLPRSRTAFGITFDIHTLLYAAVAVVIGFQSMQFWVFAKVHGQREGILPPDPWFQSIIRSATLERSLITAGLLLLLGLGLGTYAFSTWGEASFGPLRPERTMRFVIPSATAILLAYQIAFGAFFRCLLEMRATQPALAGPDDARGTDSTAAAAAPATAR